LLRGEEKGKEKRREMGGEESPAQNQPNNFSPPYISDLKSFSIALYASAAIILFGAASLSLSLSLWHMMSPARL
jgi:hypothetical protein